MARERSNKARAKREKEISERILKITESILDDYKNGRINSLLYYNNNADQITDRLVYAVEHIDYSISQLKEKVDLLKKHSNVTMHEFLKEQIWWWLSDARRLCGL